MKKQISLVLCIVLIVTVFSGCKIIPRSGKGGNFTYYTEHSVRSLDPQTANIGQTQMITNAMFDGLCRIDENGDVVPAAAESWEVDGTFMTYTFHLRENAKWSDGTPVTARDFLFGIQRALDPQTGADDVDSLFIIRNAKDVYDGLMDPSAVGINVIGDYTLTFYLEDPSQGFPALTATERYMPCNEEFFRSTTGRYGLSSAYLITNGPFCFENYYSWESGQDVELIHYSSYKNGEVGPSKITFTPNTPESIADDKVQALLNGTADVLALDNVSEYNSAYSAGCNVFKFTNKTVGLLFNTEDVSSTRIRELLVKSIQREPLINTLPESFTEAEDIIPNGLEFNGINYRDNTESSLYVREDLSVLDYVNYTSEVEIDYFLDSNKDGVSDYYQDDEKEEYHSDDEDYLIEETDEKIEEVPSITIICLNDSVSTSIADSIIHSWNSFDSAYFNILPLSEEEYTERIENKDYQAAIYTVASNADTVVSMLSRFESEADPQILNSPAFDTLLHAKNSSIENITALEKFLNNQYIFYPIYYNTSFYAVSPKCEGINVTVGDIDFTHAKRK